MNKIYIHPGLHKTGMTSLKHSLAQSKDILYLGRFESGIFKHDPHPLYTLIAQYCFGKDKGSAVVIRRQLEEGLTHKNIVLCEEWFTSDYSVQYLFEGNCWQHKLERLSELIKGFPVEVVVSIRNPLDSLYSLYCEFYRVKIAEYFESVFHFASESNDSAAYDFMLLDGVLKKNFDCKVKYFCYEDLVERPVEYGRMLARTYDIDSPFEIAHLNASEVTSRGTRVYVSNQSVLLMVRISRLIPEIVRKSIPQKWRRAVSRRLFGRGDEVWIEGFTQDEIEALESQYSNAIVFMENHRLS